MGRKSKRRGGKSKRGGKQRSPNSGNTAEIITPFSSTSLAEEGGTENSAEWEQKMRNEMEKIQMRILQGLMSMMDKKYEDMRIAEGMPPIPEAERDNPLHLTILDDELFHPRPPRSDCPICFLPLPEMNECCYQPCCGKTLCDGCIFAHRDAKDELGVENSCPFCRDPVASTDVERLKKTEERLKHDDCEAYYMLGTRYLEGVPPNSALPPFKKNHKKGLELLNQAAELGSEAAHHALGMVYAYGTGVKKDEKKGLYHLRLAAIGGMLQSRHFFGDAYLRESPKLAYKHYIIAAEAGYDESLKKVKTGYAEGHVEKDVFEKVLRAHKAAKNEVKSEARDKAAEWYRRQSGEEGILPCTIQ